MDLWVVAAAAGAGYLAKYWQKVSGEKDGLSESSSGDSIHRQSESQNLLQQIRDQTPLRRLARKERLRDVCSDKNDVSGVRFREMDRFGGDSGAGGASTNGSDENGLANVAMREDYNVLSLSSLPPGFSGRERDSYPLLPEFAAEETSYFHRFTRSRSYCYFVKPLKSSESCLTAQLYKDHAKMEEYVFGPLASPATPALRPVLVTDGSQVISRANSDSFGQFDGGEDKLKRENGVSLEENNTLSGAPALQQIGSVVLQRKAKQRSGKEQLRSSSNRASTVPFHAQGSANEMLLFFIGITVGIMSTVVANKRAVDKLNELLKQAENLVEDLHEELEMKDMLTVKELANDGYQSQSTNDCSSFNHKATASSSEKELDESTKYGSTNPDDQKPENPDLMRKIEAELEAELERLELNMKPSSLERISDFVERDPDLEVDLVKGNLKLDAAGGQPGGLSESDHDASGTSTDHTRTVNDVVSPHELTLRLHEVIESRLEARIKELETALQDSQKKVHSLKSQHVFVQRGFTYSEVGSSSTPASPTIVRENNNIKQPLVINLSGEALDAYNQTYEEIIRMTETDQEITDGMSDDNNTEKDVIPFDKRLFGVHNSGDNGHILGHNFIENRWPRSLVHDKIREERTSILRGSNEIGESEDEDDELGKLLIKQIVEKSRPGSSVILNANQILYSMDD